MSQTIVAKSIPSIDAESRRCPRYYVDSQTLGSFNNFNVFFHMHTLEQLASAYVALPHVYCNYAAAAAK